MLAKIQNTHQMPGETRASDLIARDIAQRMRGRRKELRLSQSALAQESGVSLGSVKRFERDYLISLESLIKLSVVLGCEENFEGLFLPDRGSEKPPSLAEMVAQGHQLLDQIVLLDAERAETGKLSDESASL